MPKKPRRGCAYRGCSRLAVEGGQYCAEHKKETDRQYNRYERGYASHERYGSDWQKIRARYVRQHPLCEQCLKNGRISFVAEVHHILPLSQGGTHDPDNLLSLCRSCHTKIHMGLGDRQIRR